MEDNISVGSSGNFLFWYAAHTKSNQEFKVKERLDSLGVENYLPVRVELRQLQSGKRKVLLPVIPGMIFIHTEADLRFEWINTYGVNMTYLIDHATHQSLIVPDKQMKDFMFLMDFSADAIQVMNTELRRGDKVRVIKGNLSGIEGELIRILGHKRVVVRLDGLFSLVANSYIPISFLEKL